jgi:hypothetical protein
VCNIHLFLSIFCCRPISAEQKKKCIGIVSKINARLRLMLVLFSAVTNFVLGVGLFVLHVRV